MTIPTERTRAVLAAESFLREVAFNTHAYSKEALARQAQALLRHYPTNFDLDRSHLALPQVWGKPDGT